MKTKNLLKKAFLLLALMGGATSAWADETTIVSFTGGEWTGGTATYTTNGTLDSGKLKFGSSDGTGTEGTKHVQVVLSSGTFQTGDAISITYYAGNTSKSVTPGFFFGTISGETFTIAGSIQADATSAGSSSPATQTNLTVPEVANGSNVLRLTRYTGGTALYITAISITRSTSKAYTVTAASNNNAWGTAVAAAPSLDASETTTITATPKTGYEFTSWAVEGTGATLSSTTTNPTTLTMGTANATVTATFSAINYTITHNAATGGTYTISVAGGAATSDNTTATIGQTITLAGTPTDPAQTAIAWNVKDAGDNDVTVTDNQFTMPASAVTISPVFSEPVALSELFSMTSITGPSESIAAGENADVEATFSAGGYAVVHNGHASASAQIVQYGKIYLGSSGNSYLHITFPSKLQAGDVITLGELDGNIKLGVTTSGSGASSKTFPYTIQAADASLIGKNDLYFFKDGGNPSFSSVTIEGVGTGSDLTITSSKAPTVATTATSQITYTSSNATTPTFESNATGVATVSASGLITGVAPGTAVITISQVSDGVIRAAAAKVTVTVERVRKATEVTGEFVLSTDNGSVSGTPKIYTSTDGSVILEGSIDSGSNTYNDLKNSHFKHSSNITFTLPTNYPVNSVWFVGYGNSSNIPTITLNKVDGANVTPQSGSIGSSEQIPAADCVGFKLETPAEESMVINVSAQSRGYFILNPAAKNIAMTQVGANYYATFYSAGEVTITGATAYTAEFDAVNSKVVLTECAEGVVGGRTGVILIGNSATATATPSFTGAEKEQGDLIGVAEKAVAMESYYAGSTSAEDKVFVLGNDEGKVGLYKYTGENLGVNKAYLYTEAFAGSSARAITFTFGDNITSINGVNTENVKAELKKFFENGKLVIEKDGQKFNAAGQQVK